MKIEEKTGSTAIEPGAKKPPRSLVDSLLYLIFLIIASGAVMSLFQANRMTIHPLGLLMVANVVAAVGCALVFPRPTYFPAMLKYLIGGAITITILYFVLLNLNDVADDALQEVTSSLISSGAAYIWDLFTGLGKIIAGILIVIYVVVVGIAFYILFTLVFFAINSLVVLSVTSFFMSSMNKITSNKDGDCGS